MCPKRAGLSVLCPLRSHLDIGPAVLREAPLRLSKLHALPDILGHQLVGGDGLVGEDAKPLVQGRLDQGLTV